MPEPADIMTGAPPAAENQVTLQNWRNPPYNRWSFKNVSQLLPCSMIWRGDHEASAWPQDLQDILDIAFSWQGRTMTISDMLLETLSDGFVILRDGRLVHESYAADQQPFTPHLNFSVTKSIAGLLAGILIHRGAVDPERRVRDYIPEMASPGYGDATVRNLLDMTVGLHFDEDYEATSGDMARYRQAGGTNVDAVGGAAGLRWFLTELSPTSPHGEVFRYCSTNTDVMGWIMERATGCSLAKLLSEHLWAPMEARDNAYITVDGFGAPNAAGGMCTTTRDLARIGALLLDGGRAGRRQVVPEEWVDDIIKGGSRAQWQGGSFEAELPDTFYRSYWYKFGEQVGSVGGIGIYGQALYVHFASRTVFAKQSSQLKPLSFELEAMQRAGFDAIAAQLS